MTAFNSEFFETMVAAMSDSYKYGHFEQYEAADEMVAYAEFRGPLTPGDQRIVFTGIRHIVEKFLHHNWTHQELDVLGQFMKTHAAGNTSYPWPEELFRKFVNENSGYFPVKVQAMPEGSVIMPHVPCYQITARQPYARLVTFLETLLTKVWYPSTVATLSRNIWQDYHDAYTISVDEADWWSLDYRLHDFGMRGCTCEEQAKIGGLAHLLNFKGSDTVSAAITAQFAYNEGRPVAESIPATEHSVMTSRGRNGELGIVRDMIGMYGKGVFATVGDSYDWNNFLDVIVPACAAEMKAQGGLWVVRPDSGDPVKCVLAALDVGYRNFDSHVNSKGYIVLHNFATIQGDGIDRRVVREILQAVLAAGYSAQCVAVGMGGGLLQKVNRDTLRFATKLCFVRSLDGKREIDVMKDPKTDPDKCSLPGRLSVRSDYVQGHNYTVVPVGIAWDDHSVFSVQEELVTVYDNGPVVGLAWPTFDEIRNRVTTEWQANARYYEPRSIPLRRKIEALRAAADVT